MSKSHRNNCTSWCGAKCEWVGVPADFFLQTDCNYFTRTEPCDTIGVSGVNQLTALTQDIYLEFLTRFWFGDKQQQHTVLFLICTEYLQPIPITSSCQIEWKKFSFLFRLTFSLWYASLFVILHFPKKRCNYYLLKGIQVKHLKLIIQNWQFQSIKVSQMWQHVFYLQVLVQLYIVRTNTCLNWLNANN